VECGVLVLLAILICGGGAQEEGSGDDGSGDVGSGDSEEPLVVTRSASYTMASQDGKSTVNIVIQAITSSDQLNLVCDFSSSDENVFSDQGCPPSIYLVAGHASCQSLPSEVSAKKLTDINKSGPDEVLVDATWSELPGKCILVIKKTECDGEDGSGDDGSGDDSVRIETPETPSEESDEGIGGIDDSLEVGDTIDESGDDGEGSGDIDESMEGLGRDTFPRAPRRYSTLRSAVFGRSYALLSLASFTIFSSGSTGAFTVRIPSIVSVPIYSGLTTTNYNKYATLPLLQLTGWSYNDAVTAGIATILLYLAVFQLPSLIQSIDPIKRRLLTYSESDDFASRMDALQDGLLDVMGDTVKDFASPWVGVVKQFGRNLLNRRYSHYYPINKEYQNHNSPYTSYLDQRNQNSLAY